MMKNILTYSAIIIFLSLLISCGKTTVDQEDVETGLICDNEYDIKYSDWCIQNNLKYHIAYPDILCFDSMLVSFPSLNGITHQYGNYPYKREYMFTTYFATLSAYRFENSDCRLDGDTLSYRMFVQEAELEDPEEVNVLFYFYDGPGFPVDSIDVVFRPWN